MKTLKEFKAFLLRGNVVDLAVAVVIGAAFGKVVTAVVTNLIMPLVPTLSEGDITQKYWTIYQGHKIMYGSVLNELLTFVIVAAAIFLLVVKPMNHIMGMTKKTEAPSSKECPECLSEIPVAARKCAHCTSVVA